MGIFEGNSAQERKKPPVEGSNARPAVSFTNFESFLFSSS